MRRYCFDMIVCINGEFVDEKEAKISVFDHGLLYGDGVFDTIAAVGGKIFWLEEHIDRLFEGCRYIHLPIPWSKDELIKLTRETLEKNKQRDGRIRITVTRGENGTPIYSTEDCKPNLIIFSSELNVPGKKVYEEGQKLMTIRRERFYPHVKSLNFLPSVLGYLEAKASGYDDALFVDAEGDVTEGTTFNVFVVKDRTIRTPANKILSGVTARKVIKLAKDIGFRIDETDIKLGELLTADEVFITGTTRRIIPVVRVNETTVGDEKVGLVTRRLMDKFSEAYF